MAEVGQGEKAGEAEVCTDAGEACCKSKVGVLGKPAAVRHHSAGNKALVVVTSNRMDQIQRCANLVWRACALRDV